MNRTGFFLASVVIGTLLVGCGDDDDADAASSASAQSVVEQCSGDFRCTQAGVEPFVTRLERQHGACFAGRAELLPDGTIDADEALSATWRETDVGFEICADSECLQCVPIAPRSPNSTPSAAGKCGGSPSGCYGRSAGSCGTQDGCYGGSHIRWDGGLEWECKGSPNSCSRFSSKSSCEKQEGCSWK